MDEQTEVLYSGMMVGQLVPGRTSNTENDQAWYPLTYFDDLPMRYGKDACVRVINTSHGHAQKLFVGHGKKIATEVPPENEGEDPKMVTTWDLFSPHSSLILGPHDQVVLPGSHYIIVKAINASCRIVHGDAKLFDATFTDIGP